MLTTSELAGTAAVWLLTGVGTFFSVRATVRRRKERRSRSGAETSAGAEARSPRQDGQRRTPPPQ